MSYTHNSEREDSYVAQGLREAGVNPNPSKLERLSPWLMAAGLGVYLFLGSGCGHLTPPNIHGQIGMADEAMRRREQRSKFDVVNQGDEAVFSFAPGRK